MEVAVRVACQLGEGPIWCGNRLEWLDIDRQTRWDWIPVAGALQSRRLDFEASSLARLKTGTVALVGVGAILIDHTSRVPLETDGHRRAANDSSCDARGRLWIGIMPTSSEPKLPGCLVRLDRYGLHVAAIGLVCPNGIGWSPDDQTMYVADSGLPGIYAFDFDLERGQATNPRVWVRDAPGHGRSDGLAVDTEGNVWSAKWGGSRVVCHGADGDQLAHLDLPVPLVSSCAFGGPDLDTLFITTARHGLDEARIMEFPLSGSVFAERLSAVGRETHDWTDIPESAGV